MKTREQIISEHPLEQVLADHGVVLKGGGNERTALCPFHTDSTASFCINVAKQLWTCQAGCGGGSVIDLLAKFEGISAGAVLKKYGGDDAPKPKSKPAAKIQPVQYAENKVAKAVAYYDYRDAAGNLVYQAVRMEPKSFRQRRPDGDGWIWNMEGVTRILYQLPKIIKTTQPVWIVEGEKDCDNLFKLGIVATTNVGGAGKWLEAYAEVFKDKEVILCGDNDKPGKEHMADVLASLAGKCKSVREVTVPQPHKDISDYLLAVRHETMMLLAKENKELDEHAILEAQFVAVQQLVNDAPLYDRGLNMPIYSIAEGEAMYRKSIQRESTRSLDLGRWLPSLGNAVRPMVGGEVIAILASTGAGKTGAAQCITVQARPLKTLFCSQELPGSLLTERYISIGTGVASKEVYHQNKMGNFVDWRSGGKLDHIFWTDRSRLTPDQIEEFIIKSELKIGERPTLVVVDYIQICGGDSDRRARVANAAEELKSIAKNTNTIIIILSQVARKGKDASDEITLESGKEAGEIENSSGLVLGLWRDKDDATLMNLKVLKNTKGFPGKLIKCNFDGERMIITERAESGIDDADVPNHNQPTVQQPMADA